VASFLTRLLRLEARIPAPDPPRRIHVPWPGPGPDPLGDRPVMTDEAMEAAGLFHIPRVDRRWEGATSRPTGSTDERD
jgi:hypothetical protein